MDHTRHRRRERTAHSRAGRSITLVFEGAQARRMEIRWYGLNYLIEGSCRIFDDLAINPGIQVDDLPKVAQNVMGR
jgi:hypothetical protein